MKMYQTTTEFNCGIDLHAKSMYICIMDSTGTILVHKNIRHNNFDYFLSVAKPFLDSLTIACESTFNWYWLADACAAADIKFVLGHALYMKAIHGSKTKNDRIDSEKIAHLLRSNLLPYAYTCKAENRPLRDLLRRRLTFVRSRAEIKAHNSLHVQTAGLAPLTTEERKKSNRAEMIPARYEDPVHKISAMANVYMLEHYDNVIAKLEKELLNRTKGLFPNLLSLLKSVPGLGDICALILIYEIDDINRFKSVRDFASYCRLVYPSGESAGKKLKVQGAKIGNPYLKYAFSEIAVHSRRHCDPIKRYYDSLQAKKGKRSANCIIAHRFGRAIYYMLKNGTVFELEQFIKGKVKMT